jgi:hypothetical protein
MYPITIRKQQCSVLNSIVPGTVKKEVSAGLLVDLHEERGAGDPGGGRQCGQINVEAVQQVLAAKWAVDVINNQSLPHELTIGERPSSVQHSMYSTVPYTAVHQLPVLISAALCV